MIEVSQDSKKNKGEAYRILLLQIKQMAESAEGEFFAVRNCVESSVNIFSVSWEVGLSQTENLESRTFLPFLKISVDNFLCQWYSVFDKKSCQYEK